MFTRRSPQTSGKKIRWPHRADVRGQQGRRKMDKRELRDEKMYREKIGGTQKTMQSLWKRPWRIQYRKPATTCQHIHREHNQRADHVKNLGAEVNKVVVEGFRTTMA